MHWKLKAAIQNFISILPSSGSYAAYYWMQRRFGRLGRMNPTSWLAAGKKTWELILQLDHDPSGKIFFEVGTGRVPLAPLAYWLMGAGKTITVDPNPYMKGELIEECLRFVADHEVEICQLFAPLLDEGRFADLLKFNRQARFSMHEFLEMCQIDYLDRVDAAHTGIPSGTVNFHCSYTVLEHIPREKLKQVLKEGNRITDSSGLFVHRIDYTDHFSHSDQSISPVNFLQYSEEEWLRYAGNRYMYMNRLRHDDFLDLFESVGHQVLYTDTHVDRSLLKSLEKGGLKLHERFKTKPEGILATTGAWIVSKPLE